jgi:hypothetical protein
MVAQGAAPYGLSGAISADAVIYDLVRLMRGATQLSNWMLDDAMVAKNVIEPKFFPNKNPGRCSRFYLAAGIFFTIYWNLFQRLMKLYRQRLFRCRPG